ncbi:MAG: S8 family serine peptidase [Elusimicrobiota bacterium]
MQFVRALCIVLTAGLVGAPLVSAQAPDKADFHLRQMRDASREELQRLKSRFALHPEQPTPMADVFIRLEQDADMGALRARFPQARIGSLTGRVVTARIPLALLDELAQSPLIRSIEISHRVRPALDVVASANMYAGGYLGVLAANSDLNGIDGAGVIVGIIDTGIDWRHSDFTFVDVTTYTRIRNIWDQSDAGGPNPSGFAYGSEWTEANINDELDGIPAGVVRSSDTDGHGTHIAGIAAGNGNAGNDLQPPGTFTSLASSAAIMVVKHDGTETGLLDAANYLIAKAGALGMPLVINISWTTDYGPHDGTTALEQSFSALGISTPIVFAAGNSAENDMHAELDMTDSSSETVQIDLISEATAAWSEFWFDSSQAYTVEVILDGVAGSVSATDGSNNSDTLDGHLIQITNGAYPGHPAGDKRISVLITADPITAAFYEVVLTTTAPGGTVNGYTTGETGFATFSAGTLGTVASPGLAANVIQAGSYCSKFSWFDLNDNPATDINCNFGDFSGFSGQGPTRDGRYKPDIMAPGERVGSAMSADMDEPPDDTYIAQDNLHRYAEGTSMAAAVVTSVIALKLAANPNLTPAQIMSELQAGREDGFTQGTPNDEWGYGKILGTPPLNGVPAMDAGLTTATAREVVWAWSPGATNNSGVLVLRAGDEEMLSGDLAGDTMDWGEIDLLPNTSYSAFIVVSNAVDSATSTAISIRTLADYPAPAASTGVTTSSMTANWGENDNPGGTEFFVEKANDVDFTAGLADSGWTTALSMGVTGLAVNTTYYFRGRARRTDLVQSSTFVWSSMSGAEVPASAAALDLGISSVTAAWTANGNPAGTQYRAERALNNLFNSGLANSGWTTAESYAFTGLAPNTTYYLRAGAKNGVGVLTSTVSLPAVLTYPRPPAAAAPTNVFIGSVTANWDAVDNPGGTQYYAEKANAPDFIAGLENSGWTTSTSHVFSGLSSGTTYYFRVKARGFTGIETSTTSLPNAVTVPAAPASAAASDISLSSITLNWTANGNAAGTEYYCERAANPGFSGPTGGEWTTALNFNFDTLFRNTTYYFRVKARNGAGVESGFTTLPETATLAAAPGAAAFSGTADNAVTANWSTSSNPAGTRYAVESSTDAFSTTNVSTLTQQTAMTFGRGGEGEDLEPNTTQYFRARALNWGGLPTADASLGSVVTLATTPIAQLPSAVEFSSITASWLDNSNPGGTEYRAEYARNSGYTVGYGSSNWITATGHTFNGLAPGTTYYFRARARNSYGTETAPVDLPVTQSLAAPPGAAAPLYVASHSVTALWTANNNPGGTQYYAEKADDAGHTSGQANSGWISALSHTFSGLTLNTTYYFRVKARNSSQLVSLTTILPETMTLPAPPLSASPSGVTDVAITANWQANGNPGTIEYLAEKADDAAFTVDLVSSPWTTAVSYEFTGLSPNTSYSFRVRARNAAGAETAVTALPAQATTIAQPGSAEPTGVSSVAVTANWTANSNPAGIEYYAERAADSGYGDAVGSGWTTALSYEFAGLAVNTTYYLRVKARSAAQVETSALDLPTTATLALAPQAAAFSGHTDSALTANWSAAGNPAGTQYLAEIAEDADFTSNLNAGAWTTDTSEAFTDLTVNTPYYFRVRARSHQGVETSSVPLNADYTLAASPEAAALSGVGESSVTANWLMNGNPDMTEFLAERANDAAFTLGRTSSGWIYTTSHAFTGLVSNATYYFRVAARNGAATESAATVLSSTLTHAARPVSAPPLSITENNVTAAWSANGNAANTEYYAERDTDPGFSSPANSGWITATSHAFGGLAVNTTYYFRVKARSAKLEETTLASLPDAVTLTKAPAAAPPAAAADALTVNWTANGNPAGTRYAAEISSDGFAGVFASSATSGSTALFGAGGEGSALTPGTSYQYRIQAVNHGGIASAYTAAVTTYTLANTPGAAAASDVQAASVTVQWTANGNPSAVEYQAQRADDQGFAQVQADSGWAAALAHAFTGLAPNATHYFRVRARNGAGRTTAAAALPSEITLAALPEPQPHSGFSPTALRAHWGANGNPAGTEYSAEIAADAGFTSGVAASGWLTGFDFRFTGLTNSTTYYFRVKARNRENAETGYAALPNAATLSTDPPPDSPAVGAVYPSSITITWLSVFANNGYLLESSSAADFGGTVESSSTANDLVESLTVFNLQTNTTHYLRVAAGHSSLLVYAATITVATLPNPVGGGQFAGLHITSVTLNWVPLPTAPPTDTCEGYVLEAGTDTAFGGILISSITANVELSTLTAAGLSPDTSYYFRVGALSHGGRAHYIVVGATDATFAAAPGAGYFSDIAADAVRAHWDAGGNPAGTSYQVQLSTDGFATVNLTSATRETSVLFGAGGAGEDLQTNATHYVRARAVNRNGAATPYTDLGRSFTLARPPDNGTLAAVDVTSISVTWTANGNPDGTLYDAALSTDDFTTANVSSMTRNLSVLFGSGGSGGDLIPNTTYFVRIRAVDHGGTYSAPASPPGTPTKAARPLPLDPTGITFSTITARWDADGSPAGTLYNIELSTDEFTTLHTSSRTPYTSVEFGGLTANTTYSFRVQALGHNGSGSLYTVLPTTATLLLPPGVDTTIFSGVVTNALSGRWTSGGNGPSTSYEAQLSTDGFTSINASSMTRNTSAAFGAGGEGPALQANTTHYLRVRAVGLNSISVYVDFGSTSTAANAPTATAAQYVTGVSAYIDWSPNGNAEPGTSYEVWRDENITFPAPVKTVVTTSAHLAEGLASTTSYFFKVRTLGNGGVVTAFDTAVTTTTLPPPPAAPGQPAGSVLGISSISWTWSAAARADGYRLRLSTDHATVIGTTAAAALTQAYLVPNTRYQVYAEGWGAGGTGSASASGSATTLAAPPTGTAADTVEGSSAVLSWGLNGNPAGTQAQLYRSTDNAAFGLLASVAAAGYTDYGLLGCTTYYFRVRNINGDGITTAYDTTLQFMTANSTPAAPGALTAESLTGRRIALGWTPSPSSQIAAYRLYYDAGDGSVDYGAPLAVLASTATSFTTNVLASSAAYVFGLRALNVCGMEETNTHVTAAAGAADTLPAVRAAVSSPLSGQRVKGNRLTVAAELRLGVPLQTREVLFQYKVSTESVWRNIPAADAEHPNPDRIFPYFVQWNIDAMSATAYDLRAVATDIALTADPTPPSITISKTASAEFDVSESFNGSDTVVEQVINNGTQNTIQAADKSSEKLVRIVIPAGALSASTVTASVTNNPTSLPATGTDLVSAGVSVEITLSNQQTDLAGGQMAAITLTYPDDNDDGRVDVLNISASSLRMYSYDVVTGKWTDDIVSTVDLASHTVTGLTPHFSFFALFAAPAHARADEVNVFPVPFVPGNDDPNDGVAFSAGNANSGIIFSELPESTEITIYTLSGRRVAAFNSGNSGRAQWDVRGDSGRDAASGGYFAVIKSPGQERVVRKLLIIR